MIFAVKIYLRGWFTCESAIEAPQNDVNLLRQLNDYAKINKVIANKAMKKLISHSWYMTEITVGLSFFDERIDFETKSKMVSNLDIDKTPEDDDVDLSNVEDVLSNIPTRNAIRMGDVPTLKIENLVSERTMLFFQRLFQDNGFEFLSLDPSTWKENDNYQYCRQMVKSLLVVNDLAERNVGFIKNYNEILTTNEEQKQFILQLVEKNREEIPTKVNLKQIKESIKKHDQ